MAKQQKNNEILGLITGYLNADKGIAAVTQALDGAKKTAQDAAVELGRYLGFDEGQGFYAQASACKQVEFAAFWKDLPNGDKLKLNGRWQNGTGQKQAKGTKKTALETVVAAVAKMDAGELAQVEAALVSRRAALAAPKTPKVNARERVVPAAAGPVPAELSSIIAGLAKLGIKVEGTSLAKVG